MIPAQRAAWDARYGPRNVARLRIEVGETNSPPTTRPLLQATKAAYGELSNMSAPQPIFFPTPADFRAWLEAQHAATDQLWVGYYKKGTEKPSLTWEESVEEALCYGWIDGIRKSLDEARYMIRFTPRKPASVWSQRNIELVERLTAEGRMQAAGLAAFALKNAHPDSGYAVAQLDDALPDEMVARFKHSASAWEFYQAQPPGYRKQSARWVTSAKRQETRERRLATLIDDSANHLRIKQLRKS